MNRADRAHMMGHLRRQMAAPPRPASLFTSDPLPPLDAATNACYLGLCFPEAFDLISQDQFRNANDLLFLFEHDESRTFANRVHCVGKEWFDRTITQSAVYRYADGVDDGSRFVRLQTMAGDFYVKPGANMHPPLNNRLPMFKMQRIPWRRLTVHGSEQIVEPPTGLFALEYIRPEDVRDFLSDLVDVYTDGDGNPRIRPGCFE